MQARKAKNNIHHSCTPPPRLSTPFRDHVILCKTNAKLVKWKHRSATNFEFNQRFSRVISLNSWLECSLILVSEFVDRIVSKDRNIIKI